jgi:hypothetical protein
MQTIRETSNSVGQFRVRERTIATDQRDVLGRDPRSTLDPGTHPEVRRSGGFGSHGQAYRRTARSLSSKAKGNDSA